jgi:aryl-alcohol dehydrogenase-like predicted oxidoreductase
LVERQWMARQGNFAPHAACEAEYSLLARDAERDLIPAMRAYGAGLLPFYPLASGFLTGKYKRGAPMPEGARLTKGPRYSERFMTEANWNVLEQLERFCKERRRTLLELAFGWLAAQPVVASVIAGATQAEQVELNEKSTGWELTPAELAEIDRISGKTEPMSVV